MRRTQPQQLRPQLVVKGRRAPDDKTTFCSNITIFKEREVNRLLKGVPLTLAQALDDVATFRRELEYDDAFVEAFEIIDGHVVPKSRSLFDRWKHLEDYHYELPSLALTMVCGHSQDAVQLKLYEDVHRELRKMVILSELYIPVKRMLNMQYFAHARHRDVLYELMYGSGK